MSEKTSSLKLIPVMLAFFAMGFVDLVGIASNYLKADLGLSDSEANIFPSLVFFWFLIFSVPTGMLMNRIGPLLLIPQGLSVHCRTRPKSRSAVITSGGERCDVTCARGEDSLPNAAEVTGGGAKIGDDGGGMVYGE